MRDWKIVTVNGTYKAADLDVVDINLTWLNQDVDTAIITVNRDYNEMGGAIWNYGSRIAIWDGTINVLDGHISSDPRHGDAQAETTTVRVSGVWWGLSRTIYTNTFVYKQGSNAESSRISTATYSTFHSLLNHVLGRYRTLTGLINGWTLDVTNFNLPRRDFVNSTYAEIIRWAMRWLPGSVLITAYNGWPNSPWMIFLKPDSTNKSTFSSANCLDIDWKQRGDLIIPKVVNTWEVPSVTTLRSVPSGTVTATQNGYYLVGQDSSGSGGPVGVFFYNGVMDGSAKYDVLTQDNPRANSIGPLSTYLPANYVEQIFKKYLDNFPNPEWTWVENNTDVGGFTPTTTITRKSPNGIAWRESSFDGMDKALKVADEMMAQAAFTSGYTVYEVHLIRRLKTGPHSGVTTYQVFEVTFLAVDRNTHPSRTITDLTDVPTSPTGIAANVMTGMQAFQFEGKITMEYTATGGIGYYNKITLTDLGITAPVQSVTISAANNTITYEFGPPQHLGPNDWLEFTKRK